MLNQLQRGNEPALLRCHHSVFLRSPQLGGVWRRQVLGQGNTVLTNAANGARIFVPLRFTCKPPLQGEVGYCHY